jgi:hypothetical protein
LKYPSSHNDEHHLFLYDTTLIFVIANSMQRRLYTNLMRVRNGGQNMFLHFITPVILKA